MAGRDSSALAKPVIERRTNSQPEADYLQASKAARWLLVLLIGAAYCVSTKLWGMSTSPDLLGQLGPSVRWAFFIGSVVIGSNAEGYLTGESKKAEGAPLHGEGADPDRLVDVRHRLLKFPHESTNRLQPARVPRCTLRSHRRTRHTGVSNKS